MPPPLFCSLMLGLRHSELSCKFAAYHNDVLLFSAYFFCAYMLTACSVLLEFHASFNPCCWWKWLLYYCFWNV